MISNVLRRLGLVLLPLLVAHPGCGSTTTHGAGDTGTDASASDAGAQCKSDPHEPNDDRATKSSSYPARGVVDGADDVDVYNAEQVPEGTTTESIVGAALSSDEGRPLVLEVEAQCPGIRGRCRIGTPVEGTDTFRCVGNLTGVGAAGRTASADIAFTCAPARVIMRVRAPAGAPPACVPYTITYVTYPTGS